MLEMARRAEVAREISGAEAVNGAVRRALAIYHVMLEEH